MDGALAGLLEDRDERLISLILDNVLNDPRLRQKLQDKKIRISIEDETVIPVSIFTQKMGILETIVKYLHENKGLHFKKIALLLSKTQGNIAVSYQKAKKKFPGHIKETASGINIPLSAFMPGLTCFESICIHLRDELKLSFAIIGRLTSRNSKTVFTIYRRAKIKGGERR
jgi:hypothetical protein